MLWSVSIEQTPPEDARIATFKAKWDDDYREKWGIKSVYAGKLAEGVEEEIVDVCKRAYRALDIHSYLRFDIRIDNQGKVFIIEPNANPCSIRFSLGNQIGSSTGHRTRNSRIVSRVVVGSSINRRNESSSCRAVILEGFIRSSGRY